MVALSVFDGTGAEGNHEFTLTGNVDDRKFSGTASSTATKFTAVYPYTVGATFVGDGSVSGITLPATQTAKAGSFDPNAALMMAVSTTDKKYNLDFKNAVSLVKITTDFACKKIVLNANDNIAGTGTLNYNNGKPSISFDSNQSNTITLKPATTGGDITEGTYYIVVPAITLNGFSISFHASDEYCVYTRKSDQSNIFNRSKIKDFGTFKKKGNGWEWSHTSRGKVDASQEVDMGEFFINGTKYRLIFTKSNLKKDGYLAEKESDCGDYFAWGATEPWYNSYTIGDDGKPIVESDNWKKTGGYTIGNSQYREGDAYTKYTASGVTLEATDDPARQILGGDWKLPTLEIWNKLSDTKNYKWEWTTKDSYKGYQVTSNTDASKTLFLPAASYVDGTQFKYNGYNGYNNGYYWSGTLYIPSDAYRLYFEGGYINAKDSYDDRRYGYSVRPVRLVAVD